MEKTVDIRRWFFAVGMALSSFALASIVIASAHSYAWAGCDKCGPKPACACDSCVKAKPCGCDKCAETKPCGKCETRCQHWGCEGKCRECKDECGKPLPMKEGSCITPSIPDQGCWKIDPKCCPREDYCLLCGDRAEYKLLCCPKEKKCCPEKPRPCQCKECCEQCQHLDIGGTG